MKGVPFKNCLIIIIMEIVISAHSHKQSFGFATELVLLAVGSRRRRRRRRRRKKKDINK